MKKNQMPQKLGMGKNEIARALAALVLAMSGAPVWAQTAPVGGAQTFSSKDANPTYSNAATRPLGYTSFSAMAESAVGELRLQVGATSFAADGRATIDAELTVLGEDGQPLRGVQEATLEADNGARILLAGQTANDADINKMTGLPDSGARQDKTRDGKLSFKILAPMQPGDVVVRVSVAGRSVNALISAVPEERKLFAVGLVELQLQGQTTTPLPIQQADDGDGFSQEIQNWRQQFGTGGSHYFGARSAVYLKGMISGKDLLTLSYDSDKRTYGRMFQDIDPNAMYPIYGDSSTKGIDAQSASKLYVRIDRGRSNALWGDYTTSNNDFSLSNYNRSLTGLKGHYEEGALRANAWLAYDRTSQVVDEIRGAGMSGPYSVSNPNGIKGSEQVELLVRDRNQPSVILSDTPLVRFSDYEFEVFTGRLMFRAPVPSVDSNGNPVSIRITYEVDNGGSRFATAGADAVYKVNKTLSVGASVAKDNNPQSPYQVAGVMGAVDVGQGLHVKAELAESQGVPSAGVYGIGGNIDDKGAALKLDATYQQKDLSVNAYAAKAEVGFHNPSSPVGEGRANAGVKVTLKATPALTLALNVRETQQEQTSTLNASKAQGVEATADYQINPRWKVGAGLQYAKQDLTSLTQLGSSCSYGLYSGNVPGYNGFNNAGFGLTPNGSDSVYSGVGATACGTGPIVPALADSTVTSTGVFVRSKYDVTDRFSVFGQLGQDKVSSNNGSSTLYSVGAEYRPYDMTRLYVRHERGYTFSGLNGQGVGNKTDLTTFGVDTEYMRDGHLFSEYRINDSASGRDVQHAVGLRNGFNVAPGVRLLTNAEVSSTQSATVVDALGNATTMPSNTTKALGVGVEYTPNSRVKTSGRVEWRADNQATNYLTTLGIAAQVNPDWSAMAREYSSIIHYDAGGSVSQDWLQFGAAYRPVDNNRLDGLGMIELKRQRNTAGAAATVAVVPQSDVGVLSLHLNYHPTRPWWLSGRMAYKQVNEVLPGMTGFTDTLVPSKWSAYLLGGSVKYDITNKWTLGLNANILTGGPSGGLRARQYAWGPEVGYIVRTNLMLVGGYNFTGFVGDAASDTGFEYTGRGWYLGMRWKFDESLFQAGDKSAQHPANP